TNSARRIKDLAWTPKKKAGGRPPAFAIRCPILQLKMPESQPPDFFSSGLGACGSGLVTGAGAWAGAVATAGWTMAGAGAGGAAPGNRVGSIASRNGLG